MVPTRFAPLAALGLLGACGGPVPQINVSDRVRDASQNIPMRAVFPFTQALQPGEIQLVVPPVCDGPTTYSPSARMMLTPMTLMSQVYAADWRNTIRLPATPPPENVGTAGGSTGTSGSGRPAPAASTGSGSSGGNGSNGGAASGNGAAGGSAGTPRIPTRRATASGTTPFAPLRGLNDEPTNLSIVAVPSFSVQDITGANASANVPVSGLAGLILGGGAQRSRAVSMQIGSAYEARPSRGAVERAAIDTIIRNSGAGGDLSPPSLRRAIYSQRREDRSCGSYPTVEQIRNLSPERRPHIAVPIRVIYTDQLIFTSDDDFSIAAMAAATLNASVPTTAAGAAAAAATPPALNNPSAPAVNSGTAPEVATRVNALTTSITNTLKDVKTPGVSFSASYGRAGGVEINARFSYPLAVGVSQSMYLPLDPDLRIIFDPNPDDLLVGAHPPGRVTSSGAQVGPPLGGPVRPTPIGVNPPYRLNTPGLHLPIEGTPPAQLDPSTPTPSGEPQQRSDTPPLPTVGSDLIPPNSVAVQPPLFSQGRI